MTKIYSNAAGRALLAGLKPKGKAAKILSPKEEQQKAEAKQRRKTKTKTRSQCPTSKIFAQQLGLNIPAEPTSLMTPNSFFIPFNVVSKKNSKQIRGAGLTSSEAYHDYAKLTEDTWKKLAPNFRNILQGVMQPYLVQFLFIRSTKGKFDYCNMVQGPLDLMQEHGWIDDDSADHVLPSYAPYVVSKECTGLIITVLK